MGDSFKNIKGKNLIINRSKISSTNRQNTKHGDDQPPDNSVRKDFLKRLLVGKSIKKVIEELKNEFINSDDKENIDSVILIEANFNSLKERKRLNVINDDDFQLGEARVRKSLLEIINEL